MEFDLSTVKYESDGRTHAVDCSCAYCKATYEAIDRFAQQLLAEAEANKDDQDKKKKK